MHDDDKEITWQKSQSKHIYSVSQYDLRTGETTDIGYCRTKAEADHLIYDLGIKKFEEHCKYREEKKKYKVTYAYYVEDEETRFEIKEKSLGYIYDGPVTCRFRIKSKKIFRSFNTTLTPNDLEAIKKRNEIKE